MLGAAIGLLTTTEADVLEGIERLAGERLIRLLREHPLTRGAPAVDLAFEVGDVHLGDAVVVGVIHGDRRQHRATQIGRDLAARESA